MERIKLDCGIYPGMSYEEYAKIDAVNNSLLWLMHEQSPMHVKHIQENPRPATDALRIGKAFHTRILEPDKFDKENMIIPSFALNTADGKDLFHAFATELALKKAITVAQCDEMTEAKKGKRDLLQAALAASGMAILDQSELDMINHMYEALKQQPAYQYVQHGQSEVVIVWDDDKTGVRCKGKLDYVQDKTHVISDLKSSMTGDYCNASPAKYKRAIAQHGLHQQAAFYTDGIQAITGELYSFYFLVCEKDAPYVVMPYEPGDNTLHAGRTIYRDMLTKYKQCRDNDDWPGYWVDQLGKIPGHFSRGEVEMIDIDEWALRDAGVGPYDA